MVLLVHSSILPQCRKIRILMAEKNVLFVLKEEKPWALSKEIMKVNPAGELPIFIYDGNINSLAREKDQVKEVIEVLLNQNQKNNNTNIINKIKIDINSRYIEDYSILYQAYKNIRNKSGHYNYLSKFRKHCNKTAEYA